MHIERNRFSYRVNDDQNLIVESSDGFEILEFYQGKETLLDPETFSNFIKLCEKLVRTNKRYKTYIGHLRSLGFGKGAILSNLPSEMDEETEFHHTPFNLFEVCSIVTEHLIAKGKYFTELDIADRVLELHEQNTIMGTFLQKTSHQLAHDGATFVHWKSLIINNPEQFLTQYWRGLRQENKIMINSYINWCVKANDMTLDNDMYNLREFVSECADINEDRLLSEL